MPPRGNLISFVLLIIFFGLNLSVNTPTKADTSATPEYFSALAGGKVKRLTWVINEEWVIEKAYEKVSPTNHNDELCATLIKR